MNNHLLTNARIVTPSENFIGTVEIENGIIVSILKNKTFSEGINLQGQWLIPGCIDIHTDYLEKELYPRSSASFPLPLALHFLDARAANCGITAVFSAISFSDSEAKNRSYEEAIRLCSEVDQIRYSLLVRHFLHARIDPNSRAILQYLEPMAKLESLYLVVYNDHIPGERQYRLEDLVEMRSKSLGITRDEAHKMIMERVEIAKQINHREEIYQIFKDKYILGSHDDTTLDHVREGAHFGATLNEMPTTLEAAREAKALGQWVCLGAPNYYRGGSHCGNLSCWEAMDEDLVDILCSDYHFPTMLGSVVKMIESGMDPSKAVNYVSLNPARLLKFDHEIGSIEMGKRADLVVFESKESFASVSTVFVNGIAKIHAEYIHPVRPLNAELNSVSQKVNTF